MSRDTPPFCYICSTVERPNVRHYHSSAREIRIIQGVDKTDKPFMCTTCMHIHSAALENGINIVLGTGELQNIHTPMENLDTRKEADPVHIEWVTIKHADIRELEHAWYCDYVTTERPMRILLSAGLEDILKGRSATDIIESYLHLEHTVKKQNARNELVIATLHNPPRLTWFPDNGSMPRNHDNQLQKIEEINSWIIKFNDQNLKLTPRFHRYGVRNGWTSDENGRRRRIKKHILSHWVGSGRPSERMMLSFPQRIMLGVAVTRHFTGEIERHGRLL